MYYCDKVVLSLRYELDEFVVASPMQVFLETALESALAGLC